MKIIRSAPALERYVALLESRAPRPVIGFVPTMGALHRGHSSLVRRARRECGVVIASIFVNPLQFGPREDYRKYPRPEAADIRLVRRSGADAVFIPDGRRLLGHRCLKRTYLARLAKPLCGRFRPGHFQGVVDIVALLFRLVRPDRAYFGQKDYQQFRVIEAMTRRDFGRIPRVIMCPTIRERSGLAMSSRNRYLSSGERRTALGIVKALRLGRKLIRQGKEGRPRILKAMRDTLKKRGIRRIDYVEIAHPITLRNMVQLRVYPQALVAIAVRIENTRLIDNLLVKTG